MTVIYHSHGSPRVTPGDRVIIKVNGAVTGGQGPYVITTQWRLDGSPIEGATGSTYDVKEEDLGHTLTCVQTAQDATGRQLVLKPSNQILIGKAQRGARPDRECPPGTVPNRPRTAKQIVPAVKRDKPAPAPATSKPTRTQLQAEVRKAKGGCKSCAERAKARSRRNNP